MHHVECKFSKKLFNFEFDFHNHNMRQHEHDGFLIHDSGNDHMTTQLFAKRPHDASGQPNNATFSNCQYSKHSGNYRSSPIAAGESVVNREGQKKVPKGLLKIS